MLAVVVDVQDRPCIATAAGVARFDGVDFTVLTTDHGLPASPVYDLELDGRGRVWAATAAGLARNVGDFAFEMAPVTDDPQSPQPALHVVDSLPDGRILAGCDDAGPGAGLYVLQPSGSAAHYTTAQGLPGAQVSDVYVAPPPEPGAAAEAWITTSGGLSLFVGEPEP